jgi:hypothetical protein
MANLSPSIVSVDQRICPSLKGSIAFSHTSGRFFVTGGLLVGPSHHVISVLTPRKKGSGDELVSNQCALQMKFQKPLRTRLGEFPRLAVSLGVTIDDSKEINLLDSADPVLCVSTLAGSHLYLFPVMAMSMAFRNSMSSFSKFY